MDTAASTTNTANTTIKRVRQSSVTVVDDTILFDNSVSLKALGLYTQIVHLAKLQEQGKWNFTMSGMSSFVSDGKDSIRSAMNELEDKGYIIRATKRSDPNNRFKCDDQKWVVFDNPNSTEWNNEAAELKAEGYELLGLGKVRAEDNEMATPQVGAVGGFPATGESANGVGIVENSVVENLKQQVRAVGGFAVNGEPATNIYIEKDINILPSNPSSNKGVQIENLPDGRTEALMNDPTFRMKADQLKAMSINKNNLRLVDMEFAGLIAKGYEPDEIIAEFDAVQRKQKAEGREDKYMIQLAGWLRNQAEATLFAKKQAAQAQQQSEKPAVKVIIDDGFNASTYADDMIKHWQAGAQLY